MAEHEHEITSPAIQGAQYTADDQPTRTFIGMRSDKIESVTVSYDSALSSESPARVYLTIEAVDGSELTLSTEMGRDQEPPGWFIAIRDQWQREIQS